MDYCGKALENTTLDGWAVYRVRSPQFNVRSLFSSFFFLSSGLEFLWGRFLWWMGPWLRTAMRLMTRRSERALCLVLAITPAAPPLHAIAVPVLPGREGGG